MSKLIIERMGERGDGLAGEQAIPRTLPGEIVVLDEHKSGTVLEASPDRIEPICPVFDSCGGCKLQHWKAEPYQRWKHGLVESALRAKGILTKINPLVDAHGEGRRRVTFHVRQIAGEWRAGFMAERSHTLVPLQNCPVLQANMKSSPQLTSQFGATLGNCDVSITSIGNGLDIAIKAERKWRDANLKDIEQFMRGNNICRLSLNGTPIAQLAQPVVTIGNANIRFPVGAFLQATAYGEILLAEIVLVATRKAKHIADLFCGLGPFALRLAKSKTVLAIDSNRGAIDALSEATRNTQGLRPVKTETRDLFQTPLTPAELSEFDSVVLDPPRAGAAAQCDRIAQSRLKNVVYVACDAQTFARDAAVLQASGLGLEEVTPVDQFRYSPHVELVGRFRRA